MKPKKLKAKTLSLSKQTIANFGSDELSQVKGGACTADFSGCDTLLRLCCSVGLEYSCDYPIKKETVECSYPTCASYCTYC